jgi:hypothetical protein
LPLGKIKIKGEQMKKVFLKWTGVWAVLLLAALSAVAQDSGALLDALVKKGVLSDQEAEEIRADLTKEFATTPAGKLSISNHITQLKLYGDARVRYENRWGNVDTPAANNSRRRERNRYRVRVGAEYTFTDNFKAGLQLETSNNSTSTNVTMGDDFPGMSQKTTDGAFIGLAYLQYSPWRWLTLTGGKQKNPFVNTDMVWDGDINPEGVAEQMKWTVGQFELPLNFGQFIYTDNDELVASGVNNVDTWMLGFQFAPRWNFAPKSYVEIAPTFYAYANNARTGAAGGLYNGGATAPAIGGAQVNDLNIVDIPVNVVIPVWERPLKFSADVAVNLSADDRASNAGAALSAFDDEGLAWRAGVTYGENKVKGDWSIGAFWQQTELFALDDNINDSDIFDGGLNMQGYAVKAAYNFTDFLTGTVTWNQGWKLDDDIATTGINGDTVANKSDYTLLQVDLSWKF